jgi:hypothetical protein
MKIARVWWWIDDQLVDSGTKSSVGLLSNTAQGKMQWTDAARQAIEQADTFVPESNPAVRSKLRSTGALEIRFDPDTQTFRMFSYLPYRPPMSQLRMAASRMKLKGVLTDDKRYEVFYGASKTKVDAGKMEVLTL